MAEYEHLGHMVEVKPKIILESLHYFMPHHAILHPDSSSTKLRAVFDASAQTSNNISLNDILRVGPIIQPELFDIITRFRLNRIAITGDISKMYRQILVEESDTRFQCIIWRNNSNDPLKLYQLKTVTYGTACAPYLATKCLAYLAEVEKDKYTLASKVLNESFYMDDMIAGADSLEEALQLKNEIKDILASAQLPFCKWCTNEPKVLETIPIIDREKLFNLDNSGVVKTLGIIWDPRADNFRFSNSIDSRPATKRKILSNAARIFDPLGLINPIIVYIKILLQELWISRVDWDEPIPNAFQRQWNEFNEQSSKISELRFPRYVLSGSKIKKIELHEFVDASQRAYGGCIYVRTVDKAGIVSCQLLCAKSRVAKVRTVSLPRLELCAAHLLAQLLARIRKNLTAKLKVDNIVCWTDSTIVIDWLSVHPSNWTTFVSNRTATIQELLHDVPWRHVNSKSNPACSKWLNGPEFLIRDPNTWPQSKNWQPTPLEKRRVAIISSKSVQDTRQQDIIRDFKYVTSFEKLVRIFGYICRFYNNLRKKLAEMEGKTGALTADELNEALHRLIWNIQYNEFTRDYKTLEVSSMISPRSILKSLHPFLGGDSVKLIRVGGRLQNADIPYSSKFPLLLPKLHPFTSSLLSYTHKKFSHAGPQALIAIIRQKYWVVGIRSLARSSVHRCLRCIHSKPMFAKQIMGELPAHRVEPSRLFVNSDVDFCGPIWVHYKVRGKRPDKAYLAVFICFATKAIHLEVVSDLTSAAFIAALKRFIARRGMVKNLYCDNATNFVGAKRELAELRKQFLSESYQQEIIQMCSKDLINFRFIPPRSPHFGGLWEAAVKSAKILLYKTINSASLTFEELCTLTAQIEAILNSRPLTAMSSDPSDFEVLTPGHFLVAEPLTSFVEPNTSELKISQLSRWHKIRALNQHFWNRWLKEYLLGNQQRNKWSRESPNLTIGTLVLVGDKNLPPQKWLLGRIVNMYPGSDNKVRVVSVKTKGVLIQRAVHRLCPIPFENESATLKPEHSRVAEC